MGVYKRLEFLQITCEQPKILMFVFYDIQKNVSIKPVIKGHHLYHVFCDLITMPRYTEGTFVRGRVL